MPNPADLLLDAWTGLGHKQAMSDASSQLGPAPVWVGKDNRRRFTAYLLLQAYLKNAARYWLKVSLDDPGRWEQHREYGDPALLVQTIRAAVLGGEPRPLVEGSDDELPPPPTPEDIRDRATPEMTPELMRRILTEGELPADDPVIVDAMEQALTDAFGEWEKRRRAIDAATDRQEWVDQWWVDERMAMKVLEVEDDAVGLGDGVYELVPDLENERVRVRVHEPGFYFPVHADDAQGDDFPDRIHLAWTYDDPFGDEWLRRITYERRRIVEFDADGIPVRFDVSRRYPYAPDVESKWTVVKTDARWRLKDLKRTFAVDQLTLESAVIAVDETGEEILELDLQQDYIPLIHIPNTSAIKELWGESALTRIAQILDDLAATDADLAVSSALVASPAITISGGAAVAGSSQITTYGPGMVFRTGDGTMNVLDTSHSLDALTKMQDRLMQRLSVVRQVPESVLGRVELNNQLAGITLLLSFGPFRQYIEDLRLPRVDKYALLLKFVQRTAISHDWLKIPVADANLAFGPFLPTDQSAVVGLIVQLVNAKVISRATGMRMGQEAGVPIESIEEELAAVRHEDIDGAERLANALGSEEAAADYLGVTIPAGDAQSAAESGSQPPGGEGEQPPGGPGTPPAPGPGGTPPTPLP